MSLTGGVRRSGTSDSAPAWTLTYISALTSAIYMNSKFTIFFTTFGGRIAAGLYGPKPVSADTPVRPWAVISWACFAAAAASTSRPVASVGQERTTALIVGSPAPAGPQPQAGLGLQ